MSQSNLIYVSLHPTPPILTQFLCIFYQEFNNTVDKPLLSFFHLAHETSSLKAPDPVGVDLFCLRSVKETFLVISQQLKDYLRVFNNSNFVSPKYTDRN
jgi:hypothetical protein